MRVLALASVILDARDLDDGFHLEADLCIVGTGAAGLTLAALLDDSKISICLLESGGYESEPDTQDLYRGNVVGGVPTVHDNYLHLGRLRFFGGTTNHWGGLCRTLDPMDFEQRDWVPHSGWPFSRSYLDPYYQRASEFMGIGEFDTNNPDSSDAALPSPFDDDLFEGRVFRIRPRRFGPELRKQVAESKNLRLVHHANAVEIVTAESGGAVEQIRVATLTGRRGRVSARQFVLATGAIENSRLLLASNRQQRDGVGNQHGLVGRFFMEHPVTEIGMGPMLVWPGVPLRIYRYHGFDGPESSPDPADRLARMQRWLEPGPGERPDVRMQVLYLKESVVRRRRRLNTALVMKFSPDQHDEIVGFDRSFARASLDVDRASDSGAARPLPQVAHTTYMCEHAPNPESRVTLSDVRDALDMPRVTLSWRLSGSEVESIYDFAETLARNVAARGHGRLKFPTPPRRLPEVMAWGWHHMGTTRMNRDPKQGVVDPDCRVHAMDNLYVAGSSVFPTSGAANPTFTIIALAVRMAEHLKHRLGVA